MRDCGPKKVYSKEGIPWLCVRGSQRDVVYLVVYEPNAGGMGGGAESQPMNTAVHSSPSINFGDLTQYLTFALRSLEVLPKKLFRGICVLDYKEPLFIIFFLGGGGGVLCILHYV